MAELLKALLFLTQQFLLDISDVVLSHEQSCKSIPSLCDASG